MKFTDGFWMVRQGFRANHPAQAYEVEQRDNSLVVHAPFKSIKTRDDTLNCGMVTVVVSTPCEDVLKVRISHFAGTKPQNPSFVLDGPETSGSVKPKISIDPKGPRIDSGRLSARFSDFEKPWRLEFYGNDTLLTASENKGIGYIEGPHEKTWVHEQLSLDVGELVYGLGERFSAFTKNGQVVDIWNLDGGTASEQTYKNIPFYLSNRGYGVLVNHSEMVNFEVASEKVSRVQFSVEGQYLEYFIFFGSHPKEVLERYTGLTGRPPLPPAWSFGLWLTTSFSTSYDEKTVNSFIDGMAERNLPLSVIHFDCFWMREFHWSDFLWDSRTFPNPKAMLTQLKARGLRVCVWINPYIAQRSALFAEGHTHGYLLRKPDGDVWQTNDWQAGMGIVDFTNPAACTWYAGKLAELMDMGVDAFKTDFGERIPTNVVWHSQASPQGMHNFYPYLYNKTVFDIMVEKRGPSEAMVFARSATVGCQKFPVHWGGDCNSTFPAMAESLRGGLSLGLSGFGFWSHDIGGFEGTPPVELFERWIAFGLLSSHSRLHGSKSYRVPWVYGDGPVEVLRYFTQLKISLMPYLMGAAVEAQQKGTPLLRAMMLEFPQDPGCSYLDRQYMLGESLLVAPVFSKSGEVEWYLPAGSWTNLLTKEKRQGPCWQKENHSSLSLPLWVRPSSIVLRTSRLDKPDHNWTETLVVEIYELDEAQKVERAVHGMDGSLVGMLQGERVKDTISLNLPTGIKEAKVMVYQNGLHTSHVLGSGTQKLRS